MKKLLLWLGLIGLFSVPVLAQWDAVLSGSAASSGGVCSPPQGDLLNDEGFETPTTGYQQTGWNTATGSPDPAYSISGFTTSKPNGSCSQGFRSNYSVSGTWRYNSWDIGSPQTGTVYVRFYMYVASQTIDPGGDFIDIAGVFNFGSTMSGGGLCGGVRMENVGGQLSICGNGATQSTVINISTGQWYRVELKVVMNGTSEIKVNGGTAQTFTSTGYTTWRSVGVGSYSSSSASFTYNDTIFDLIAADDTGYIGPTP